MKILCRHCGTTNNVRYSPFAHCGKCRQRLPLTLPRPVVYAARTLWRPLFLFGLVIAIILFTPVYKNFRETQKIGQSTTF